MRNKTSFEKVSEFHKSFGHPVLNVGDQTTEERIKLRISLIVEEVDELFSATFGIPRDVVSESIKSGSLYELATGFETNIVEVADALADISYVVCGMALELGIPLDEIISNVHDSNMSKLGEDGKPIYREDGKILKGPNFIEPDILKILDEMNGKDPVKSSILEEKTNSNSFLNIHKGEAIF